jgi:hypothetical protein
MFIVQWTTKCFLRGFVGLGAVVLLSCVPYYKPYPAQWGALVPINDNICNDISGEYVNLGEWHSWNTKSELLEIFIGEGKWPGTDTIRIEQPSKGIIHIQALKGSDICVERTLLMSRGEFECSSEGIKFSHGDGSVSEAGGATGTLTYHLRKAADGSLIAKYDMVAIGALLYVIPVGGTESSWMRFTEKH